MGLSGRKRGDGLKTTHSCEWGRGVGRGREEEGRCLILFVRRDWARSLTEGDRGLEVPGFSSASRTSRPSIWRRVRSWKVQRNPPAWHDSHWRVSGMGSHLTLRKRLKRGASGTMVRGAEGHQGEKDGPFVAGCEGTRPLTLRGRFLRALDDKGVLA